MNDQKIKDAVPVPDAYAPKQLTLFQDFLCNTTAEKEDLSNTIELWDTLPKYSITRRQQSKIRKDGYLPIMSMSHRYRGQDIELKIKPARILSDGQEIEYYPSVKEDLVEDALRKMACCPGYGFYETGRSGVSFTLHELRQELKKRGHTMSYYQVVESLEILSGCKIEIGLASEKALYKTSPLTSLIAISKKQLKKDPKSRWHVEFSLLVTLGIKDETYRQFNYGLNMGLKTQLSRLIHKKMSHHYTQASMIKPYTFSFSGISRDSGLLKCKKLHDNKRKLEDALDNLKGSDVILSWNIVDTVLGKARAIQDLTYSLTPHIDFVSEQKKSTKRGTHGGTNIKKIPEINRNRGSKFIASDR